MRFFSLWKFLALLLLMFESVSSQSSSSKDRDERTQRRYRQRQQQQKHDEETKENAFYQYNFDWNEFISRHEELIQMHRQGPKHVLEALWNTLWVSGSALVIGATSAIGVPLVAIWTPGRGNQEHSLSQNNPWKEKAIRLVAGGLVGGGLALTSWLVGIGYAMWQTSVGIWRTPSMLCAKFQSKVWHHHGTWQHYNLSQHYEVLKDQGATSSFSSSTVRDDSLYQILEVETKATSSQIKRAYYDLAKKYHPDKTSDSDSAERFLQIHRAYEILKDPQSRKRYDEMGIRADENDQDFDSNIFFDVLFGVSSKLESYIGTLDIKLWSHQLLTLVQKLSNAGAGNSQEQQMEDIFMTFWGPRRRARQDLRQVEIALYLQEFTKDYVLKDMEWETYLDKCQQEVEQVAGESPSSFVQIIGETLFWQGLSYGRHPSAILAWTRQGAMSIPEKVWFPIASSRLGRQVHREYQMAQDEFETKSATFSSNKKEKESQRKERQRYLIQSTMEHSLAPLMEFVHQYNQKDISLSLRGACWKLFYDFSTSKEKECSSLSRSQQQRRLSQAITELGRQFLKAATSNETSSSDQQGKDYAARLQVAWNMAMGQAAP